MNYKFLLNVQESPQIQQLSFTWVQPTKQLKMRLHKPCSKLQFSASPLIDIYSLISSQTGRGSGESIFNWPTLNVPWGGKTFLQL